MKTIKPSLIPVIAAIIVIIAAMSLAVFYKPQKQIISAPASAKPSAVYAPKGEIAPGFPKELILDSTSAPEQSYQINYPQGGPIQRTTDFSSSKSMADLFAEYKVLFSQDGWEIKNEITQYPTSRGLYAERGGEVASVAIIDDGNMREVTANYLGK